MYFDVGFFWDVDSRSNGKRTILLQISNNKKGRRFAGISRPEMTTSQFYEAFGDKISPGSARNNYLEIDRFVAGSCQCTNSFMMELSKSCRGYLYTK